ncbi:hypothetical protein P3X46_022189 [Hevea brasiliensis]|uniref:Aspartic peptidase DDI1-type domain-containing protein n=1 Tax=Hevea brasiliensis TaxID=3981 RepID=A0ABQ9LKR5_HEVBR|nr:hypothetical protein P3X46_022189 [Hevea brasiliensis]
MANFEKKLEMGGPSDVQVKRPEEETSKKKAFDDVWDEEDYLQDKAKKKEKGTSEEIRVVTEMMEKLQASVKKQAEFTGMGLLDADDFDIHLDGNLPEKFKMPDLAKFDGTGDPKTHLRPPPNPLPPNYNANLYCQFHQTHGHDTDRCFRLKHEVQDLIDAKKIADPENRPNTRTNPMPNHNVPPPPGLYMISTTSIDPDQILNLIQPIQKLDEPRSVMTIDIWDNGGHITFSDHDLPAKGRNHSRALFVTAEVGGWKVPCVMIDDGSAINVCPLKILPKLGISMSELTGSDLVIRAYDDSKRNVIGVLKIMVKVGPIETEVEFTVLDIPMTFSLLLGRIWFHPLGGVPSTLHQKIKIPHQDGVITINAERDGEVAMLQVDGSVPLLSGFQVAGIYGDWMDPRVATMMKEMKFFPGMGAGKAELMA